LGRFVCCTSRPRTRRSSQVLLRFPARLFEHAGEKVSERFASVVLREHEVSAGYAELFGALKTICSAVSWSARSRQVVALSSCFAVITLPTYPSSLEEGRE
jgi:hypothetical protein